ncbi:MAG: cyclase family protein [Oscillospiraceae bacterium]|nr:cyclase family protein [Oscillospiraceae bacterium]
MKVFDLTQRISEGMPVYPGTEEAKLLPANTYEKDGFRETLLSMTTHTGTHMDPPAHLFPELKTLDSFDAEHFVGRGAVIDCRELGRGGIITMEHINRERAACDEADFILFCTGWSRYWCSPEYFGEYPVIDAEVADYIIKTGKKGIGFDTIGLDPISDANLTLHKRILGENRTVIIENLTNLEKLIGKSFTLCAFPLNIENADGSPIRAMAMCEE